MEQAEEDAKKKQAEEEKRRKELEDQKKDKVKIMIDKMKKTFVVPYYSGANSEDQLYVKIKEKGSSQQLQKINPDTVEFFYKWDRQDKKKDSKDNSLNNTKKLTSIERSHHEFSLIKKEQQDAEQHLQYIGKFRQKKNKSNLRYEEESENSKKRSRLDENF